MIPIHEYALQVVIPEQGNQHSHNYFCQNKDIVYVIAQETVDPSHAGQPFGQGKRTPRIQQYASSPHHNILQHNMCFLAVFGMKDPPIVDGTIHNTANDRSQKRCIQIKDIEQLEQKNSHQKVYQTGKLGGKLGFEKTVEEIKAYLKVRFS